MRLIIANPYFPPFSPGGAEDSLIEVIGLFVKNGIRVEVFTNAFDGISEIIERDGYQVHKIFCPIRVQLGQEADAAGYLYSNIYKRLLSDAICRSNFVKNEIKVILANNTPCYRPVIEAGCRTGTPTVAIVRDAEIICSTGACIESSPAIGAKPCQGIWGAGFCNLAFHRKRGLLGFKPILGILSAGFLKGLERKKTQAVLSSFSSVVTISHALNNLLKQSVPSIEKRLRIIPNPATSDKIVEDTDLTDFLSSVGLEKGNFIVAAGKKSWGKGSDILAESAKELGKNGSRLKVLFVGKGKIYGSMSDNVIDHPSISKPLLLGVLQASTALVIPGRCQEGLHRSMLDALQIGTPIICTNAGGVHEGILEGKNGKVIPCNNVGRLVNAIQEIDDWNEEKRLICKFESERLFKEKFSNEVIFNKWKTLFNCLI